MADTVILFQDDFQSFPIGPLPFDREHSAMGEYHYSPLPGYRGQWYDPIANCNYRGPSWLVTATDGVHYMEQTRVRNPLTHGVCPVLATGEEHWHTAHPLQQRGSRCAVPLPDVADALRFLYE